jgi:hypothetical protein
MGAQKWFKFYGQEYLSDPKIERLTPTERSCWVTLLCMASLTEGTIRFLTVESLLTRSGIHFDPYHPEEWESCLGILRKFQDLEMITCKENGDIILLNWEKRQETNLTDAERAKSYRDRKKERHANVTEPVTTVTQDKSRVDKSRVDKNNYGDLKNVRLSDVEHAELVSKYGLGATSKLIGELSTYMASKGKAYKNHYATLLNWAKRKGIEEVRRNAPTVEEVQLTPEQVQANNQRALKVREALATKFKMPTP